MMTMGYLQMNDGHIQAQHTGKHALLLQHILAHSGRDLTADLIALIIYGIVQSFMRSGGCRLRLVASSMVWW